MTTSSTRGMKNIDKSSPTVETDKYQRLTKCSDVRPKRMKFQACFALIQNLSATIESIRYSNTARKITHWSRAICPAGASFAWGRITLVQNRPIKRVPRQFIAVAIETIFDD